MHLQVPYLKHIKATTHRASSRRERTTENPMMLAVSAELLLLSSSPAVEFPAEIPIVCNVMITQYDEM